MCVCFVVGLGFFDVGFWFFFLVLSLFFLIWPSRVKQVKEIWLS